MTINKTSAPIRPPLRPIVPVPVTRPLANFSRIQRMHDFEKRIRIECYFCDDNHLTSSYLYKYITFEPLSVHGINPKTPKDICFDCLKRELAVIAELIKQKQTVYDPHHCFVCNAPMTAFLPEDLTKHLLFKFFLEGIKRKEMVMCFVCNAENLDYQFYDKNQK